MTRPNPKNLEDFANNLKPGRKWATMAGPVLPPGSRGDFGEGVPWESAGYKAQRSRGQRLSCPYSHLPRGVPRVQIGQLIYPSRSPNSEDFHFLPFTKPNIPKPNTWLGPPRKETRSK